MKGRELIGMRTTGTCVYLFCYLKPLASKTFVGNRANAITATRNSAVDDSIGAS